MICVRLVNYVMDDEVMVGYVMAIACTLVCVW